MLPSDRKELRRDLSGLARRRGHVPTVDDRLDGVDAQREGAGERAERKLDRLVQQCRVVPRLGHGDRRLAVRRERAILHEVTRGEHRCTRRPLGDVHEPVVPLIMWLSNAKTSNSAHGVGAPN